MEREEGPVLSEDEVVVPPAVLAAVAQLDDVQHAPPLLARHLVPVSHRLAHQGVALPPRRLPLPLQDVLHAVLDGVGLREEDKHLAAHPGELVAVQLLFVEVDLEGVDMGQGDPRHAHDHVGEVGVEGPGQAAGHGVGRAPDYLAPVRGAATVDPGGGGASRLDIARRQKALVKGTPQE